MKKTLLMTCAVAMVVACVQAQSWLKKEKEPEKTKGWIDNFEQAQKEAEAFKQPIFAFFTGSDWCGWCVRLKKEALDTKEFEKFAADNLILFEADFPRAKKISDKVKKQNDELASKYGVRGYPTVFLLDAEGKQLGRTGYKAGGAEAYVKHLKEMLETAGVKTVEKPEAAKPLSAYEKMKAERAAKAAQDAEKK
ncbi:MAG: thioredoxin family protein [Kiritimatiellae bacterium]|jgi:thioredoxin-related protein|nr:thioredoxin family protein [Kiritimatiellia bacterium]MDD2349095.1 thioredoxin family protein [Kiritimatiellia bacterium]MDD3582404.1 thioredoxin family protein [Kiritimatiellia bacterium]HHU15078.1 thioredoxin family protein [Lentisphaerota bacterium]HON47606.1 thioredoxin family protein [Kiritimatiellia bacterium]